MAIGSQNTQAGLYSIVPPLHTPFHASPHADPARHGEAWNSRAGLPARLVRMLQHTGAAAACPSQGAEAAAGVPDARSAPPGQSSAVTCVREAVCRSAP